MRSLAGERAGAKDPGSPKPGNPSEGGLGPRGSGKDPDSRQGPGSWRRGTERELGLFTSMLHLLWVPPPRWGPGHTVGTRISSPAVRRPQSGEGHGLKRAIPGRRDRCCDGMSRALGAQGSGGWRGADDSEMGKRSDLDHTLTYSHTHPLPQPPPGGGAAHCYFQTLCLCHLSNRPHRIFPFPDVSAFWGPVVSPPQIGPK